MRILVASLGSPGHTYPLVPLAQALRDAGHAVSFAVGAEVTGAVRAAGLEVVVAGIGIREGFARAWAAGAPGGGRSPGPEQLPALIGDVFGGVMPRAAAADLLPWIDAHRPDLVIAEVGNGGAALAARAAGVPCARHSFGRTPEIPGDAGERITECLGKVAAELGVPWDAESWDAHPDAYLDICPPSLQGRATADAILLRPVAWNPAVPFTPRRPAGERPWVYLTLGTAMGDAGVLRAAVEGLRRLDVDVLVAAGAVAVDELVDLAVLDPHVQVEGFVPQATLLPEFALAVHHGGSGTTLGAAAAGVPQLVLPQGADQFGNAEALEVVGVGRTLREPTADAVAEAAATLLAGAAAAPTRALAAEIAAMPSPDAVAARIAGLVEPDVSP